MEYPVHLKFKNIAIARQANMIDADGNSIAFARQKILKLKEELEVFQDSTKSKRVCTIKADRVIDFRAAYGIFVEGEQSIGSIKRKGLRSLWRATYLLNDWDGSELATIVEEKPFAKVIDGIMGDVPLLGLFCNYVFNPSYVLKKEDGTELFRITKSPSLLGSLFKIDKLSEVSAEEEILCLMGLLMMIFLEKARG
ncbi:MAG: hypothetical protein VX438_01675 [Planctomycetota bacterium]|nr:hypothetical protein [Planctomycetota bacterium]